MSIWRDVILPGIGFTVALLLLIALVYVIEAYVTAGVF